MVYLNPIKVHFLVVQNSKICLFVVAHNTALCLTLMDKIVLRSSRYFIV